MEPGAEAEQPPTAEAQPARGASPRRTRKPTWTTLIPTTIRLDEDVDDRVTVALQTTGMGLQEFIEQAINVACDALSIPKTMPEGSSTKLPRDPNAEPPGTPTEQVWKTGNVRLKPNTRMRLAAACDKQQVGGKELINDAVADYLDDLGIEGG
ncbi:hypothetical protein [Planotetraspora phitsanulokensis]|nr:hypothetical protein [Planotetraspora phitsanulokensis]